jgi:hypothetical protein
MANLRRFSGEQRVASSNLARCIWCFSSEVERSAVMDLRLTGKLVTLVLATRRPPRKPRSRWCNPSKHRHARMSELVKERVLRTLGEIRVSSSLTPRSIIVSRSLIDLKGLHGMKLRLEEKPLKGVRCFHSLRNGYGSGLLIFRS